MAQLLDTTINGGLHIVDPSQPNLTKFTTPTLKVIDDGDTASAGANLFITACGNTFLGSGEGISSLYTTLLNTPSTDLLTNEVFNNDGEKLYLSSDSTIYLYTGLQTIEDRRGIVINTGGSILPVGQYDDTYTNIDGSYYIGKAETPWNKIYSKAFYSNAFTGAMGRIGEMRSFGDTAAVAVASDTSWHNIFSFKAMTGRCLIVVTAAFPSNATGRRGLSVHTSAGAGGAAMASDYRAAVNGAITYCRAVFFNTSASETQYYVNVMQNSGSSLSVSPRVYMIRISG